MTTEPAAPQSPTTTAGATMLNVPRFAVSTFNMTQVPTEFSVLCSVLSPGVTPTGEIMAGIQPVMTLSLSPHAAKDLIKLLETTVADYEKVNGPLSTPYTRGEQ